MGGGGRRSLGAAEVHADAGAEYIHIRRRVSERVQRNPRLLVSVRSIHGYTSSVEKNKWRDASFSEALSQRAELIFTSICQGFESL